jgi:hypothetical protein
MVPSSYGNYDLFSISHAGKVYKSLKTDGVVSFIVLLLYFVMVFIESVVNPCVPLVEEGILGNE